MKEKRKRQNRKRRQLGIINEHINDFRKRGILEFNKISLKTVSDELQVEKRGNRNEKRAVYCRKCKKFLTSRWFSRHKCSGSTPTKLKISASAINSSTKGQLFKTEVIDRLRDDETGKLCKNDETIRLIGFQTYNPHTTDNQDEHRKRTTSLMRQVSHVYTVTKRLSQNKNLAVLDLFRRPNTMNMENAIHQLCYDKNKKQLKNGMSLQYFFAIQNAGAAVSNHFSMIENDGQADAIDKFCTYWRKRWQTTFQSSEKANKKRRIESLRAPSRMPGREALVRLQKDIMDIINQTIIDCPPGISYIKLRRYTTHA